MRMFNLTMYQDSRGICQVRDYIGHLSKNQQDKVFSYINRLALYGFDLRRPTADSLGSGLGLYELRPGRHRIVYFFYGRAKAVMLSAFLKETDEIPTSEIETAVKRRSDYFKRMT